MGLFDLNKRKNSYIFGFLQADSHFSENTRNRGRIDVELAYRDQDIIYKMHEAVPVKTTIHSRTRDTNFKKDYKSIKLSIFDLAFREEIKKLGLPVGKKSKKIKPPTGKYYKIDYWRGIIDGDGSIGFYETEGWPFVSLFTESYKLAKEYRNFLAEVLNKPKKKLKRNSRDDGYNIMISKEDAVKLVSVLYYENCICLNRKLKMAQKVIKWTRPVNLKLRSPGKNWTPKQDMFILNNQIEVSIKKLKRSEQSIKMRLWRLKNAI